MLLLQTGCQVFYGFHYPGERNAVFIFSLIIKSLSSFISERHPKPKGYVLKYLYSNSGSTNLYQAFMCQILLLKFIETLKKT